MASGSVRARFSRHLAQRTTLVHQGFTWRPTSAWRIHALNRSERTPAKSDLSRRTRTTRKARLPPLPCSRRFQAGSDPLHETAALWKRSSPADPIRKSSSQGQRAGGREGEVLAARHKCRQTLGLRHRSPAKLAKGFHHG